MGIFCLQGHNFQLIDSKGNTIEASSQQLENSIFIYTNHKICEPCVETVFEYLDNKSDIEIGHLHLWNTQLDRHTNIMSLHQRLFDIQKKYLIRNILDDQFEKILSEPTPILIRFEGQNIEHISLIKLLGDNNKIINKNIKKFLR